MTPDRLANLITPYVPSLLAIAAIVLTISGVHNYHPRHLVQALDFVDRHRSTYPLGQLVDGRFALADLDVAFKSAAERQVVRAAVVP